MLRGSDSGDLAEAAGRKARRGEGGGLSAGGAPQRRRQQGVKVPCGQGSVRGFLSGKENRRGFLFSGRRFRGFCLARI